MEEKFKILGIVGSLRAQSYNKALMRAAIEMAPAGVEIETVDLEGIPMYNQDLENQPLEKVIDLKARIGAADAILIATPEYNYSIPGVLKNAIDCASRPYGDNALANKAVAVMGASIGMSGTARAQYHLRQCFVFLGCFALNQPEVMVSFAQDKFDGDGRLTDQHARENIRKLLEGLVAWTKRLASSQ